MAPFTPERYREAIWQCEDADKQVIIIDSLSPEWAGEGGYNGRIQNHTR
ncbi:MAG: hypothetical protein ICV65_04125 [Flavisolibacter sp.]|nr:hypothetical protein [Flavisolibacter sp.]